MMRTMRGKIFAILIAFLLLCCPAAFAQEASGNQTESFLDEYVAILKRIEAERMALADERTQIVEARRDQMLDDKLIDAFTALIDQSMARLEAEQKRLETERAWIEREKERVIQTQRTPVRVVTIDDPLIHADLSEKISRYWGN